MIKIFPYTVDGDQLSIEFEYNEEKYAFEGGLEKLRSFVKCMNGNKGNDKIEVHKITLNSMAYISATSIKDTGYVLKTLEMEMLQKNISSVLQILGINICNIYSRNEIYMRKFL